MKKQLKKLAVVITALAIFTSMCGFTFSPSKLNDFIGYCEFTNSSASENLSWVSPNIFSKVVTVDGKSGAAGEASYARHLYMNANTELFAGVHKVKVTVEWFDAVHGQPEANKFFRILYPNLSGTPTYSGWHKGTQSGKWITTEIQINDIDFSKLGVLHSNYPTSNIDIYTDNSPVTMGTEDTSDDYYAMLVRSVRIEPLEETYKLEELNDYEEAVYSVNDPSLTKNITPLITNKTPMTVTDSAGVTMTGEPSADASLKEYRFILDTGKFKDVKTVNVTITWYDAISTAGTKACINLRWPSTVLNPTWNNYAQETGSKWQPSKGVWTKSVYTLSNCNFSDINTLNRYIPHNFHVYTTNALVDNGTADDTSDDIYGILVSEIRITPVDEYSFSGLRFTNGDNTEISALEPGGDFYTDLTVTRTGGEEAKDVTVITCLYDGATDKLLNISYQTKSIDPDGSKEFNNCFTAPEDVTGNYVKIMVWDTMNSMVPISNELICRQSN